VRAKYVAGGSRVHEGVLALGRGCLNVFRDSQSIVFSYDVAYSVQVAGR